MARSLWTGSLSFGLVNVPVALFSGVRDTDVHFRQLHGSDHTPVETRRFCSKEDEEVDYEEIGHGFETDSGKQVVLTDEELAAAAPRKTRTIEIEAFVDLADVDPIYFDHPYILMPAGDSEGTQRAYRLLLEVMSQTERAALGRFVMRTKEYLVLIRERGGRLSLTTLRFHDEVRDTKGIPTPSKKAKPAKKQVDQAVALIEALAEDWDPARYKDRYQQRLKRVIKRKEKGETVKAPEREDDTSPVPDLMAALEKTLAEIKDGKRKTPA
jgi:DNA end-binding protein Ku